MLIPTGFWSYTTSDETSARGKLSQLRALLAAELQQQIGREPKVNIFQDVVAIPPGEEWDMQIRKAIGNSSFMIPIITPGFLQSEWCCREVELFREREADLRVKNLVFPVHYVNVSHVVGNDPRQCYSPDVLTFLRMRQWTDFRPLRLRNQEGEDVAILLEGLAQGILRALREAAAEQEHLATKRGETAARADRQTDKQHRAQEDLSARRRADTAKQSILGEERRYWERGAAQQGDERPSLNSAGAATSPTEGGRRATGPNHRQTARSKKLILPRRVAMTAMVLVVIGILIYGVFRRSELISDLGELYENGTIVSQDYDRARAWYEIAAASGSANAMNHLGDLYASGRGVDVDTTTAHRWYEKAAEAGNVSAMRQLELYYHFGIGGPQDESTSRKWGKLADAASID